MIWNDIYHEYIRGKGHTSEGNDEKIEYTYFQFISSFF